MNDFFTTLLNMSLVASLLIVAVVVLRLVLKKAPKAIICVLWALVGLRLVCPFSFESNLSLVPDAEPVTYIREHTANSETIDNIEKVNRDVVSYETEEGSVVVVTKESVKFNYAKFFVDSLPYIWVGGVALMAVSSVVSYIRLRRRIIVSVNKEANIFRCDGIKSPFILGVIKPKIYIPSHLNESEQSVVIAHEKAHLRRLDHLWKPLGYLILTVHWFNPLVWVAYALLCRDIEGACDEYVVKKMSIEDKKLYSETLLSCSAPRHMLTACPVAFGEVSVKGRVKSVLSYKKPAFWIIIAAVAVTALVAVLFMTNPAQKQAPKYETPDELIRQVALVANESVYTQDNFVGESHYIFDTEDIGGNKTVYYVWLACVEYSCENGELQEVLGGVGPKAITMKEMPDGTFELIEYWEPTDGEGYSDSIKEKFPAHLHTRVLYGTAHNYVIDEVEKSACEHYGITEETKDLEQYPRFTGEILEVTDDHYLVALIEGDTVMGQSFDKLYVHRGAEGDRGFIKGDIILVHYANSMVETDPPCISANSISLCSKVFWRIEPQKVEFYRVYEGENMTVYANVNTSEDKLKNIEVYRYMPETPIPPENIPEGATYSYNDGFAPYLCLDYNTGYATFAYSYNSSIVGIFDLSEGKLTINGFTYGEYYPFVNNQDGDAFVFNSEPQGFVFDKESSDYLDTYQYELDGKVYEDLPSGAVFEDILNLEVE